MVKKVQTLQDKRYTCGYCSEEVTSNQGYYHYAKQISGNKIYGHIYICHSCSFPTYFDSYNNQYPNAATMNLAGS